MESKNQLLYKLKYSLKEKGIDIFTGISGSLFFFLTNFSYSIRLMVTFYGRIFGFFYLELGYSVFILYSGDYFYGRVSIFLLYDSVNSCC